MNNIRKVVDEKSLKVACVARTAKISRSHLYDIINGTKNPSIVTARKIARALEATIDELFPVKADTI